MNSQDFRNLQEAYLQIYSSSILNEFGPGDAGGSLAIKRTFGGAPGTRQNTTVSGSAASGNSNISGSITKGTFSGQGDKTSQGIDNAIKNYQNQEKPDPKYQNKDTSTSTITKGISGTLNANISGGIGPGNKNQENLAKSQQKAAMLRTAASNIAKQNQQAAASASGGSRPAGPEPDNDPRPKTSETPNDKYLKNRADLVRAGVTDESGNENPGSKRDLENRLGGKDGATAGDLLTKLRHVSDTNNASQLKNATGVRKIVHKGGGVYGTESFDLYDIILSHLLDEGYADTQEQAQVIMVNMSEDWRESICEGYKRFPYKKVEDKIHKKEDNPTGRGTPQSIQMGKVSRHFRGGKEIPPVEKREHSPQISKAREAENRARGAENRARRTQEG